MLVRLCVILLCLLALASSPLPAFGQPSHTSRIDGASIAAAMQGVLSGVEVRLHNRGGNASRVSMGPLLGNAQRPLDLQPFRIDLGRSANERYWIVGGDHGYTAMLRGGKGWGNSRGVQAMVFANVDSDLAKELVVGRNDGNNLRWAVIDDASGGYRTLHTGGTGWGDSRSVSALAAGDVDGDGRDEIIIGRDGGGNMRWTVIDDRLASFSSLHSGGGGWGDSRGVTALATGDVDGDGRDEIVIGRDEGKNMRWAVIDDRQSGFASLHSGGSGWGKSRRVTALATGDVDGDGRDEVIIGRDEGGNMRWAVVDDRQSGFAQLHSGGGGWGDSRRVSALATGDVDGDGRDEVVIGRDEGGNMRWAVVDDRQRAFAQLHSGGGGWGSSRGVTALAAGDIDGDGRSEIVIGRNEGNNQRWAVVDDQRGGFRALHSGGQGWGDSRRTTAIALGNVDSDRPMEIALGRDSDSAFSDAFLGRITFFVNDIRSMRGVSIDDESTAFRASLDFETGGREIVATTTGLVASFTPDVHVDAYRVEFAITPTIREGRPSYSAVDAKVLGRISPTGGVCRIPSPLMDGDICDYIPGLERSIKSAIERQLEEAFMAESVRDQFDRKLWEALESRVESALGVESPGDRLALRFAGTDLLVSLN